MTELVFILDRSGSMSGLEKDTIGGFNSMLEKQRKEPGDAVADEKYFYHIIKSPVMSIFSCFDAILSTNCFFDIFV